MFLLSPIYYYYLIAPPLNKKFDSYHQQQTKLAFVLVGLSVGVHVCVRVGGDDGGGAYFALLGNISRGGKRNSWRRRRRWWRSEILSNFLMRFSIDTFKCFLFSFLSALARRRLPQTIRQLYLIGRRRWRLLFIANLISAKRKK